jgi:phenylalanine-4-hydroxylase
MAEPVAPLAVPVTPAPSSVPTESRVSLLIEISDQPGALHDMLRFFWKHEVNLTHIESRPVQNGRFDFYVDCAASREDPAVRTLLADLELNTDKLLILDDKEVPWFPRHASELDVVANRTLDAGTDLESDHPGFLDEEYRARRGSIDAMARAYVHGDVLPAVAYSCEEVETWGVVYRRLRAIHEEYACAEFERILSELERRGLYSSESIPQAADVSDFLQRRTGFRLRPVAGLLGSRDFLSGLAFRVFFSTQYIRHHSKPLYTPEPDICHELIGHAPMFADPAFAEFSQEIGLASLGASDEEVVRLARCYWHAVEFGLLREGGELRAYGAGLLSSFGELEYACAEYRPAGGTEKRPELLNWSPQLAAAQDFPITEYQPRYFVAESLQSARESMQAYCRNLPRPFYARYQEATDSVWVDRAVRAIQPDLK